jgi:hypothetical protein
MGDVARCERAIDPNDRRIPEERRERLEPLVRLAKITASVVS